MLFRSTITQGKEALDGVGRLANSFSNNLSATPAQFGDTPWNPASASPQGSTTGVIITFSQEATGNPNYNPATGIWTIVTPQSIQVTVGLSITNLAGAQPDEFWAQVKVIRNRGGIETAVADCSFYNLNGLWQAYIDTTFDVIATDLVYLKFFYQSFSMNKSYWGAGSGWSCNNAAVTYVDFDKTKVGEYQLPVNCATKVGYMLNEKYPMFIRLHYKNGYISSPYYLGMFDNSWGGSDKSIYSTSTGYDTYTAFAYYANISDIDLTGVISDINGFSIWRGVCNPTILGSGMLFPADNISAGQFNAAYYPSIPTTSGAYASAYGATDEQRRFGMFFSHDTRLSKTQPSDGDTITYFDCPVVLNNVSGYTSSNNLIGSFAEYYGEISTPISYRLPISDGRYVDFSEAIGTPNANTAPILSKVGASSKYYRPNINTTANTSGSMENMAMGFKDYAAPISTTIDNGAYMAQYVRPVANQYDIQNIEIVPTGTYVSTLNSPLTVFNNIKVFGGDTYTQKNIVKLRYWSTYGDGTVRSSFISYYGQQKINTQLFYCDTNEGIAPTRNLQGWKSISKYLFPFATQNDVAEEQFNYDTGYSANYPFFLNAYNSKIPNESQFPSRIYYSQQKPINSVQDFYRKILAADYRDLDTKNGPIAAIRDTNNYMVAVQPRAVSVLPYLSDVAVSTQGGGEVLIGNGGVYNQRENIISTYGTSLMTCVLSGNNNNGNSQLYWYSPEFKKMCRYGADGIRILSDENNMRSYFLGINPTAENQMRMGYDVRYASVIISMPGRSEEHTSELQSH